MLEVFRFEKGWLLPALFCGVTVNLCRDRISIGIYTHHIRRSDPSVYGVNIGCFDEINIRDYLTTDINDGVSMSLAADHSDG